MTAKQSELLLHVVEEDGRVTIGFPADTMLSEANADDFSRALLALTEQRPCPHLLVDLGGVTMMTSVILAKFLAINNRVRATGGRLTLFNAAQVVREVFKVTRLDTILEFRAQPHPVPV